ncbi:MAG: alpha/beta fold hydrolase [Actinomycetota bacterium]|nr:alpha/beta fold hydrolase [Actinomycetota bacterium]
MTSPDAAMAERRSRRRRRLGVGGIGIACLDLGQGVPVVLLHGPGTSSALWEPVAAQLSERAAVRCHVPDLPGWGASDPLPGPGGGDQGLDAWRDVVDELLVGLDAAERAVIGGHGWGATLAFDRARRHPHETIGVIHADAVARPLWSSELSTPTRKLVERLRADDRDRLVADPDAWVDDLLSGWEAANRAVERELRAALVDGPAAVRRAFLDATRCVPIDGSPATGAGELAAIAEHMAIADVPKLHVEGDPGWFLGPATRAFVGGWPNQRTVRVDAAHLTPLSYPTLIADAISSWLVDVVGVRAGTG